MCFKRVDLYNHVSYNLDENGSPVCTIDSIRSFHTLLLQSPCEDQAPEPPDVSKKVTYHIRDLVAKSHRFAKRMLMGLAG